MTWSTFMLCASGGLAVDAVPYIFKWGSYKEDK